MSPAFGANTSYLAIRQKIGTKKKGTMFAHRPLNAFHTQKIEDLFSS